jgi:hypothetical protein
MSVAETEPRGGPTCGSTVGGLRRQLRYGIEHGSNRVDATAQPAHGTGQAHFGTAEGVGGGFNALRRRRDDDRVLDLSKQARHPAGKEVR